MTRHSELLMIIRETIHDPHARDFVVGWCLAGLSEHDLQRLADACDEVRRMRAGDALDLMRERFGEPQG